MSRDNLRNTKFHFVGIGGIGMCGLAELLFNMGARVTGSDLAKNMNTAHLESLSIRINIGHAAENVREADVVVYSSAVHSQNPEIVEAGRRKIPIIARAEALAEIMRLHRGLAVAGTHGKTTTTSMAAAIFLHAGAQPTIVVGGRLDLIKSTALLGSGEWLIAEADESDGSFNKLSPEIAIVTNIDNDHLDHFRSVANLKAAFLQFASKIPFYGAVIACGDDPLVREVFSGFTKRILFYGFDTENDFVLKGAAGEYFLSAEGQNLGGFSVHVPGRHNALNAAAAIVAGLQVGFTFEVCAAGIAKFQGVDRRFQRKGERRGVIVYEDYGHHPTEIRATLQAFREKFPKNKLCVLFQPHRYSRTELCWPDFLDCFALADRVWITDIYAAGEPARPKVTAESLAQALHHTRAQYVAKGEGLVPQIACDLASSDILITLGAGDVAKYGVEFLQGSW